MKIVTLGTGHGDPTRTRFQSSSLIQTGGRNYLVDCGEPASASLIRNGVTASELSAVFVTHMHSDHVGGLPALLGQAEKCFVAIRRSRSSITSRPVGTG